MDNAKDNAKDNTIDRIQLKSLARKQLRSRYWPALLVCMLAIFSEMTIPTDGRIPFTLVGLVEMFLPLRMGFPLILVSLLVIAIIQVFIAGPITVGKCSYFVNETENAGKIKDLFFAFRTKTYWNIIFIMFLYLLIILGTIGVPVVILLLLFNFGSFPSLMISLPLLLGGVMWAYRYRFIPYFMAQYPNTPFCRSIYMSKLLTEQGVGVKLIFLDVSFLGWYLIGGLLFGLGIFLVRPYHEATFAQAYKFYTEANLSFQSEVEYEMRLKGCREESLEVEEIEVKIEKLKAGVEGLKAKTEEMKGGTNL